MTNFAGDGFGIDDLPWGRRCAASSMRFRRGQLSNLREYWYPTVEIPPFRLMPSTFGLQKLREAYSISVWQTLRRQGVIGGFCNHPEPDRSRHRGATAVAVRKYSARLGSKRYLRACHVRAAKSHWPSSRQCSSTSGIVTLEGTWWKADKSLSQLATT